MRGLLGSLSFVLAVYACDPSSPDGDTGETDAGGPADAPSEICTSDEACSDEVFCNGRERCRPGASGAEADGCLPAVDVTPCLAGQSCDEAASMCVTECSETRDADGDGIEAIACGGLDCDDSRATVSPDEEEVCDAEGIDEDCDPSTIGSRDLDGDGATDALCCNDDASAPGGARCGTDCDDLSAARRPGATEICDDHDDDCDGAADEGVQVEGFLDADRDRHGDPSVPVRACVGDPTISLVDDDCDDTDPRVHRGQLELCDARDNDCDTSIDEDARSLTWYRDSDGDGFGSAESGTLVTCAPPVGHALLGTDCDDGDRAVSPIAPESCNGRDDDCNGVADYRIGTGDFEDDDGDGRADARCRFVGTDCDDRDPFTYAGAPELCDLRDNDCNDLIDDDTMSRDWLADEDGDGYGDATDVMSSCAVIDGRVLRAGDCDDAIEDVFPGALDGCGTGEGRDDDCDTRVDEAGARTAFYADLDGDTFGAGAATLACTAPLGRVAIAGDCDDGSTLRSPAAAELCEDGIDQDCDGGDRLHGWRLRGGAGVRERGRRPHAHLGRRPERDRDHRAAGDRGAGAHGRRGPLGARRDHHRGGPGQLVLVPDECAHRRHGPCPLHHVPRPHHGALSVDLRHGGSAAREHRRDRARRRRRRRDEAGRCRRHRRSPHHPARRQRGRLPERHRGERLPHRRAHRGRRSRSRVRARRQPLRDRQRARRAVPALGHGRRAHDLHPPQATVAPPAMATLCSLDVMLVDAPRQRLYLVDLTRGQMRRVNLTTGTIELLADGSFGIDAYAGAIALSDRAIRAPFLPANIDPQGRVHFVQPVLDFGQTVPTHLFIYDPATGIVQADELFSGDPEPDPVYTSGDYRDGVHLEPMGFLPGAVSGALRFQGEGCQPGKSGFFYSIGIIDDASESGLSRTCGLGFGPNDTGALGTVSLPGRVTALGLDARSSPMYATDGSAGPALYRIGAFDQSVARVDLELIDPVRAIASRASGEVMVTTRETVIELRGVGAGEVPLVVTPVGPTTLNTIATGEVAATFETSRSFASVGALSGTPGGGSFPTVVVTDAMGNGTVTLTAGWTPGTYAFSVGSTDIFGVLSAGPAYSVVASTPPAGTLTTLLGYPYYIPPGDPRGRGDIDGPATALTVLEVTGVEVAADGTTYVGVANIDSNGSLYRITPAGQATRLDRAGGFPADGPLSAMSFNRVMGLELDEANQVLYVTDGASTGGGARVILWRIDLTTQMVERYAGAPSTSSFADGTPRLNARIENAGPLTLGPDGNLYFGARTSVGGRAALRYIDGVSGTFETLIPEASDSSSCGALALFDCSAPTCALVFPPTGDPVIVGTICGSAAGCSGSSTGGVFRRSAAGVLSHVAGRCGGVTTPGSAPAMTRLSAASGALFATPNDVIVGTGQLTGGGNYVWRIPLDGRPTAVIAGTGVIADDPDPRSGPALSTRVRAPHHFARRPDGRVVFADGYSLRMVW
jgi:hypothetical protein